MIFTHATANALVSSMLCLFMMTIESNEYAGDDREREISYNSYLSSSVKCAKTTACYQMSNHSFGRERSLIDAKIPLLPRIDSLSVFTALSVGKTLALGETRRGIINPSASSGLK